jgi:uncharacterized cupredoxin-like copper-binding protein
MKRTWGIALITVALAGTTLLAGCSDDDDTSSTTTTAAAEPDATPAATGDTAVFCDAVLAGDQLFSSDAPPDPAAWDAIVEDLEASTPDAVADEIDFVIGQTTKMVEGTATDAGPSPEYLGKLNDVHGWMADNCSWPTLEVAATDYAFTDLPSQAEAGKTILSITNEGEDAHEMSLMRINDDVTESVEDLVALPEDEAMSKVTPVGGPFAVPGEVGFSAVELTPGRYAVVCFIPQGTNAENMEEVQMSEGPGGTPHAMLGMIGEFEVA